MRYRHLLGKEIKAVLRSGNTPRIFISGIEYKKGISLSFLDKEEVLFCLLYEGSPTEVYKEVFKSLVRQFINGYFNQNETIMSMTECKDTWGDNPTMACPFK